MTGWGRLFCIVFAMFGIPLTMLILANVGKHLSHLACRVYLWYVKIKQRRERRAMLRQQQVCLHAHEHCTLLECI